MMLSIALAACLIYIAAHALLAINNMSRETCTTIRATYILIAIGSVSGLCEMIDGRQPVFSDAILIGGIVLYFLSNKRRDACREDK